MFDVGQVDDARGRILVPRGQVDVQVSHRLRQAIGAAVGDGGAAVVLDLSNVEFMDSTGLSTVIGALKQAWASGQALLVSGPLQPAVASLFAISGLESFVTIHPNREAALGALER